MSGFFLGCTAGALTLYCLAVLGLTLTSFHVEHRLSRIGWEQGESIDVSLAIQCRSLLPPVWCVLRDEITGGPLDRPVVHQRVLFGPFSRKHFTYTYRLPDLPRGMYRFEQTELSVGDLFGFVSKRKRASSGQSFAVYPKPLELGSIRHAGQHGGLDPAPTAYRVPGTEPTSMVRDYAPGDPLNRIHWRTSARAGSWRTRELEPADRPTLRLVLDSFGNVPMDVERSDRFETAVRVAAGLLHRAALGGVEAVFVFDSLGSFDGYGSLDGDGRFAGGSIRAIKVRGADGYRKLLPVLAGLRPGGKPRGLSDMLQAEMKGLGPGNTVVCIAGALDGKLADSIERWVRQRIRFELIYPTCGSALKSDDLSIIRRLEQTGGCQVHPIFVASQTYRRKDGVRYAGA